MSSATLNECAQRVQPSRSTICGILLFVTFLVYSSVNTPVPGVNEPHYLAKSKHYWIGSWCAGDLFLESSNAHLVFYQTIGQLTRVMSFEAAAWTGRVIAFILLAFGWNRLIPHLVEGRWAGLWTAWAFLFIATIGSFSGEWLVGGIEAKVIAYAFLFLSLAFFFERRWNRVAICLGLAISFHPLVGMWSLLTGLFAWTIGLIVSRTNVSQSKLEDQAESEKTDPNDERSIHQLILATSLLVLCSLPGLIPALQLISGIDAAVSRDAAYIQVFYRLRHHLDPMAFTAKAYSGTLVLVLVWLIGRRWLKHNQQEAFFARFVVATFLTAVAGVAIGFRTGSPLEMPFYEFRMQLLKFYPFRLFDVMLPLAVAVVVVGLVQSFFDWQKELYSVQHEKRGILFSWILFSCLSVASMLIPAPDSNPSKMRPARRADWIDACRWISEEIPEEALFFAPNQSWAFKWYAKRAEYVSYKDCPQDAVSLVEWNRRLKYLATWSEEAFDGQRYPRSALMQLKENTGITHLIEREIVRFDAKPLYQNKTYRVYRLD